MNPELRRNFWLELTPQRVIVAPIVLLLLFTLGWLVDGHRLGHASAVEALVLFLLTAVIWGARLTTQSLTDEFAQGTWDAQRGSGLSAWHLVSGKIFGGASFAWFAGLLCVPIYLLVEIPRLGLAAAFEVVAGAITAAALVQATALLLALAAWRKSARQRASRSGRSIAWLIVIVLLAHGFTPLRELAFGEPRALQWYGTQWSSRGFVLVSALLFCGWALLGATRLMRAELQLRDRPAAWVAFVLFVAVYLGGWIGRRTLLVESLGDLRLTPELARVGLTALLAALATYVTLFYERKDWTALHRLGRQLHKPLTAARDTPLWLASLLLTLVTAATTAALAVVELPTVDKLAMIAGTANVLCFVLRDVLLVVWLNAGRDPRRGDAAAAPYLAILYGLLPVLLVLGHLAPLGGLFNPFAAFAQPVWVVAGAAQLALMLDLTRRRRRALLQARN